MGADLPVLVVKYLVNGSPSDPSFGGSYYDDAICPPVLVPGRPIFVDEIGDLANHIKSWFIQKLEQKEFTPYCFEFFKTKLKFDDLIYIPSPPAPPRVPIDPPAPCSTSYFATYSFPPLNASSTGNADIYANNALGILDPDNAAVPVGLTITVPGPTNHQSLLLTNDTTRQDSIDVSYLFNTPVNTTVYPNYPINTNNNFPVVIRPTSSSDVAVALAQFPYVDASLAKDVGSDGEKENQVDKSIREKLANLLASLNPKDGNPVLTLEPKTGTPDGGAGCLMYSAQATLNGSLLYMAPPNDPVPVFGVGSASSFDERVIGGGIGVIANPEDPGIVYHSGSGSVFHFAPIYDTAGLVTGYSSPPSTDWTAFTDPNAPVNEQIKLQSKTGDLTYSFSSDNGYLYKVNSAQGGEISFTRPAQYPAEASSIQTSSGYTVYATFTNHLLTELSDNLGSNHEYFGYDNEDRLHQYQDPLGNVLQIDYTQNNQFVSVSLNQTPKIIFDYDPVTPTYSVSSLTDACNHTTSLSINPITQESVVEDALGHETTYSYYHEGTLESVTDDVAGVKSYIPVSSQNSTDTQIIYACNGDDQITVEMEMDDARNLVVVRDANDEETTIEYDDNNKPTSVTDREGQETITTYTQDGSQPASVTYPDGRVVSYSYGEDTFLDSITTTYKTGTTTTTAITRDQYGYIDTITDPMDNETDFDYDRKGRLLKTTDPLGRETEYTYDARSRLTDIDITSDLETKTMSIVYDAMDQITQVIDPAGHDTTFGYSNCGDLVTVTNFLDQVTTYEHDALGRVTSITDANDHTSSAEYDTLGRIISITDPENHVTTYEYDGHSRLSEVIDPLEGTTLIEYDVLNRITSVTNPNNEESSFVYNKEGYLTQMTDPRSQTYHISYLDGYRVDTVTGPLNSSLSYEYFPFGGVSQVTNALDQSVTYDYNENHQIISATDIQDRTTHYYYDDLGRITEVKDSIDRSVYYRYDEFGNVLEIEDALGNISQFEYDISNNVTAYITPTNDRYEYTYDGLDRVTAITDPLDHVRQYTYDDVGNTTSFEDPLEHVTHWVYNAKNQLEQTTDALDQDTLFDYDANGRLTQVTDTLSRETNFEYDALGQLTSTTNPRSNETSYQYDPMGNLTKKIKPATATTTTAETDYTYDALNRLSTITSPFGNETSFTYNTLSMLTDISLPTDDTIEFTYDAYNKLTEITASDNHTSSYTYDSLDRVTEAEDSLGGSTLYEYDDLDRLTEITGPDNIATSYMYDASSRMITSTYNTTEETEYTYDAASRLTLIEAPGSRTYTLAYDVTDKLREEGLPSGVTVNTLYDEIDRPYSLTYTLPGGSSKQSRPNRRTSLPFTFTEFSLMLLAFKLKQSDLSAQIQEAGELNDQAYKQMVQINNDFKKALMTPITIASFDPTYDSESNITEEDINLDAATQTRYYTYDNENQLLTADTPNVDYTYTYDQRNNRLTQRMVSTSPALDTTDYYTYNKEDELTAWERRNTQTQAVLESYTFSYNELGDCISQTKTSVTPNEVTEYEYYVGGNLKQVTLPDDSEIEYLYDANSNRIQKTTATEIITYHYAGSELKSEVHQNKQNQNILYTLTYYPYGFEKTVGQTTTAYYYIYDNRGFVWAITDDSGDVLESYDYSPYGELLSTPTLTNHLFLSGADQCMYDEETKMVHLNNRYYLPKLGRFLQRDSVEGSPTATISQNLYTYCQNSPITLIDPSGNTPQNTGTPPRPSSVNAAAFGGDMSCYMPDINQPVAAIAMNLEAIPMMSEYVEDKVNHCMVPRNSYYPTSPAGSAEDEYSSCSDYWSATKIGDGLWELTINGDTVYIRETIDENGRRKLTAFGKGKLTDGQKQMIRGLNEAFGKMYADKTLNTNSIDTKTLLEDIVAFGQRNYYNFKKMYSGANPLSTFLRHTTIGGAIKQKMQQEAIYHGDYDKGQYDMEIGFWVSYWTTKYGWNVGFGTTGSGENAVLGLVDIAFVFKSVLYKENAEMNPNHIYGDDEDEKNWDGSKDYGVSSINENTFKDYSRNGAYFDIDFLRGDINDTAWQTDPFINIGAGMGVLFYKSKEYKSEDKRSTHPQTLANWKKNVQGYNDGETGYSNKVFEYYDWIKNGHPNSRKKKN